MNGIEIAFHIECDNNPYMETTINLPNSFQANSDELSALSVFLSAFIRRNLEATARQLQLDLSATAVDRLTMFMEIDKPNGTSSNFASAIKPFTSETVRLVHLAILDSNKLGYGAGYGVRVKNLIEEHKICRPVAERIACIGMLSANIGQVELEFTGLLQRMSL